MFGPYQQFQHMQGMADDTMSAFGRANALNANAAQSAADRAHEQAMQQQRLNAQMQMQQMDMQEKRERHSLLGGLLKRSMGGGGGFRIDGRGNYSEL